jgi:hypothetical protein
MQERERADFARTPLERLLVRQDEAALAWLTERLLLNEPVDPDAAPLASEPTPDVSETSEVEG